ncbi:MAG: DUF2911 domain-containing protein [Chitinophagaceae bacterium]
MKKLLFSFALLFATQLFAQPINMPQPSPIQTIKQNFGLGNIELSYSRPSVKNRSVFKENSELAPIDQVWRTGANAATTITFSDEVSINGVAIKAGKYGLLSIPSKKEFTIIISKDVNVNQPSMYKQENDVVRFTAPIMKMKEKAETFTMQFANVNFESIELHIMWDNVAVSLPITTNVQDRVKADIAKNLAGDKPNYQAAANFYYEMAKDYPQALSAVTKAIDANKNAFWLYLLKARIESSMGDKASAKASAEKCIQIATEAKNTDYVRSAKELISKL